MFEAKEHAGRLGRFWDGWAFSENRNQCSNENHETFERFMKTLEVRRINVDNSEFRDPRFTGDETFIYRTVYGYKHNEFHVVDMPEWMTIDDAALVVDWGNLCFGYSTSGSTITVYTD